MQSGNFFKACCAVTARTLASVVYMRAVVPVYYLRGIRLLPSVISLVSVVYARAYRRCRFVVTTRTLASVVCRCKCVPYTCVLLRIVVRSRFDSTMPAYFGCSYAASEGRVRYAWPCLTCAPFTFDS